ncbi:restriction endonuclease subunit S [Corynebacterium variabile]|uniref:restriction endonuclease subunit S n=1 Tax=Corynebacterium variabile TaxID=1727 RepID=UPI003FD29698
MIAPLVPLKFVAQFVSGGTPSSDSANWDGDLPFVTPPDLNGLDGAQISLWERSLSERGAGESSVVGNAVLLSCRAPIGHIGVTSREIAFNQGCKAVIPEDPADLRFLAYSLVSIRRALETAGRGTTFTELSTTELSSLVVPWPDSDTRILSADYLDRETSEIDAVLENLSGLSDALRDRAQVAQTRSVFGLAGGQRHSAADAHSPLSGIPEHWDRTKFGYDFTESTERNGDEPPGPLLSISEYRGVELNTRTEGQQASLDVSKYRVVRPGQLAANMMWLNHGGLGVSSLTGYISPDYKAFWISDRLEPRYVHHLFRSSRYIDYFAAIATGVRPNAQRVTKTVLDATPVPLPPLDEQVRIADELDEVTTRVDVMLAKVADLKALLLERRAALITDVVTGRKEVA